MTKLTNSNCDTQKKNSMVTNFKNSNSEKRKNLICDKTKQNSNCDQTKKEKFYEQPFAILRCLLMFLYYCVKIRYLQIDLEIVNNMVDH